MKKSIKYLNVAAAFMFVMVSCDFIKDMFPNGKSELTFKATSSSKTNLSDTVLFTGNDIKWLNGSTGEIRFVNSGMNSKIKSFRWIKCYLGTDSLFTATVSLPVVSALINDIVLNYNLEDGNFYFKDGYPDWIENKTAINIRKQNRVRRSASWDRFIEELKKEDRFAEK